MKWEEKIKSITLRKQGYSIGVIAKKLNVSKSSVSLWVRDIELTEAQIHTLSLNPFTTQAVEKRRQSRLISEERKRASIISTASQDIASISKKELWLIGVALYWAEGGKTQRMVRFSNGDPHMVNIMLRFFKEIGRINDEKFRGHIHIHSHLDHIKAEQYWSDITGIPLSQFYKTYRRPTEIPNKKDTLPFGVLDIYALDTHLFLKLEGWKKGIIDKTILTNHFTNR